MKLFGLEIKRTPAIGTVPISTVEVREEPAVRADLSREHIARVNEQIRTFGEMKRVVSDLIESADRMKRGYDAAVTTQFNTDFKGTYGTANTEIFSYFYGIWARARTLAKDTPQGKAILRTHRNNVVGHNPFSLTMRLGKSVMKPHPLTGEKVKVFESENDSNQLVEQEWQEFCQPKNFTIRRTISMMEAAMQMVNEAKSVGGVLIRMWDGAPNKYGFAVDLLEIDRLQPNFQTRSPVTGYPIRASIERDPTWDFPVAYWVLTRHPGEFVQQNYPGGALKKQQFRERIDAKDIIHFNNLRDRAEQDIGFTELDACIQAIWRLFQYQKALTYASISSCMKPFWIKKNYPTGMFFTPDIQEKVSNSMLNNFSAGTGLPSALGDRGAGEAQRQQGIGQRTSVETPGSTLDLDYGLELMQTDPKFPIEAAHEFQIDNSKEIAAAAAISYADLTGDFQSLGYIAAQMSQRPSRDEAMVFQEHIIMVVFREIFERWWRAANLAGVFDFPMKRKAEMVRAARFRGRRFPFTDELREVQALILKLDAKVISPQQAQDIMPDGVDVEDLLSEWSSYYERCAAYGIPIMDAPTAVNEREQLMEQQESGGPPGPATAGEGDEPGSTSKPVVPKGSSTAKMQKSRKEFVTAAAWAFANERMRRRDDMTQKLLSESLNGVH